MPEPDPTIATKNQRPHNEPPRHQAWIKPLDNNAARHACAWLLFAGFGYVACAALRHTLTDNGLPLASMLALSITVASIGCAIAARRIARATTSEQPPDLIAQTVRNARPLILCALATALGSAAADVSADEPIAATLLAIIASATLPVAWLSRSRPPDTRRPPREVSPPPPPADPTHPPSAQ